MKKIILVFLLCIPLFAQRSLITRVSLDSAKTTLNTRIDSLLSSGITDSTGISGLVHDSINTRFGGSTTTSITNTTKTLIDDSLAGYTKYVELNEGGVVNKGIVLFYNAVGQYVRSSLITIWDDSLSVDWNGYDLKEIDSLIVDGKAVIDSLIVGGYASIIGFSNTTQTKSFIGDSLNTRFGGHSIGSIQTIIDDSLNTYFQNVFPGDGSADGELLVAHGTAGRYAKRIPMKIEPNGDNSKYGLDADGGRIHNVDSLEVTGTASIDTIRANYISGFSDTLSYSWGIMDTVTTGDLPGWKVPTNITIIEVAGYTDANTTTFNIEERTETTPNTAAATDVMDTDLAADVNQQEVSGVDLDNIAIAQNSWLVPTISATGDVALFSVTIRYVKVY